MPKAGASPPTGNSSRLAAQAGWDQDLINDVHDGAASHNVGRDHTSRVVVVIIVVVIIVVIVVTVAHTA